MSPWALFLSWEAHHHLWRVGAPGPAFSAIQGGSRGGGGTPAPFHPARIASDGQERWALPPKTACFPLIPRGAVPAQEERQLLRRVQEAAGRRCGRRGLGRSIGVPGPPPWARRRGRGSLPSSCPSRPRTSPHGMSPVLGLGFAALNCGKATELHLILLGGVSLTPLVPGTR